MFMLLVVLFCASDSGIGLESGVYVTAIVQGSPAAREGSLTVGDRLIAVSACWKSFLKFFFSILLSSTSTSPQLTQVPLAF